jgi:hypothetical protein
VWIDGIADPIVASRTERTVLHDMGQDAASQAPIIDHALDLADRLVAAADAGRADPRDLGRRARRPLAATTGANAGDESLPGPSDPPQPSGPVRRGIGGGWRRR